MFPVGLRMSLYVLKLAPRRFQTLSLFCLLVHAFEGVQEGILSPWKSVSTLSPISFQFHLSSLVFESSGVNFVCGDRSAFNFIVLQIANHCHILYPIILFFKIDHNPQLGM